MSLVVHGIRRGTRQQLTSVLVKSPALSTSMPMNSSEPMRSSSYTLSCTLYSLWEGRPGPKGVRARRRVAATPTTGIRVGAREDEGFIPNWLQRFLLDAAVHLLLLVALGSLTSGLQQAVWITEHWKESRSGES